MSEISEASSRSSVSNVSTASIEQPEIKRSDLLEPLPDRSRFLRRRQKEVDAISSGSFRTERFRLDRTNSDDNDYNHLKSNSTISCLDTLGTKAVSSPMDWELRRRRHQHLLQEVNEDDNRARILPKPDPLHSWSRLNEFVADFDERDLRYLTKEGRQDIVRLNNYPTLPANELPYRAKRKSTYAKWLESL